MKALTLYVPHAVLIPFRWKEVETRDWYTGYRGPLAIHAAKRYTMEEKLECSRLSSITARFDRCCSALAVIDANYHLWPNAIKLSLGCVVATCDLAACLPTSFVRASALKLKEPFAPWLGWDVEFQMGDYSAGRWAWILRNIKPVNPPIPARGLRKLWEWSA